MGNDAVYVNSNTQNDKHVQIAITDRGSDFYYAICAVMGTVTLGVLAAAAFKPRTHRIFFYITAAINFTATIAYFAMGSNLGWTPIDVEFLRSAQIVAGRNREIFYVRYIDWFVTTPLLLMDILLTAGLPWPTIIWTIFMDWVMIITGLVGALVKTRYKWGFYTFGCAAMLYIFWIILFEGRAHVRAISREASRVYLICGVWTLFIWCLYPVAWGVAEGGNVIAPDSEAVFYGILDFCAKPVFSVMLLVGHWNIDPAILGLRIRDVQQSPELYSKDHLAGEMDQARNSVPASTGTDAARNGSTRRPMGGTENAQVTPPAATH